MNLLANCQRAVCIRRQFYDDELTTNHWAFIVILEFNRLRQCDPFQSDLLSVLHSTSLLKRCNKFAAYFLRTFS